MQCQAIKKNGDRCQRMGKKLCWQHQVIIYSISSCPYCIKAKNLLSKKHIPYKEIIVNKQSIRKLMKITGQSTVPQIFINGQFIGGYTDLVKYI